MTTELINGWMDWSAKAFPKADVFCHLDKAREELREAMDTCSPEEFVDVIMCMLSAAKRMGISAEQLTEVFEKKLVINVCRKWKFDGTSYRHL